MRLLQGDWFAALGGERYDLIVSNPPYVAAADPHLARVTCAMSRGQALASGGDGLDALRNIVAGAFRFLTPGGALLIEHGHDQGHSVRGLMTARRVLGHHGAARGSCRYPARDAGVFSDRSANPQVPIELALRGRCGQRKETQ